MDSKPEPPRTRYELRAGFVVPATMISGINSDLPGQVIGQVSQNVYDTPTGKYLLIPQGSRLVGSVLERCGLRTGARTRCLAKDRLSGRQGYGHRGHAGGR